MAPPPHPAARADIVRVRLVGSFAASRAGDAEPVRLGSRKARRLLALLAVEPDRLVPLERIVDVLWPVDPPRRPGPDVATLVSRLRAVLGSAVIGSDRGGYRLGPPPYVVVDLDEAAALVAECARLAGAPGGTAAGARALQLLGAGGVLLDEPDAEWVREVRIRHERLLREARHAAAAAALQAGDPVAARDVAEAAIRQDRLDEAAHRLLMSAHQAAGEPARALLVYQGLRETLADELGVDPAPDTRAVYEAVLAERDSRPWPPAPAPPPVHVIGRSAEVGRLRSAWDAAVSGRSSTVLIAGEGGIGKSLLAADLAATVRRTGGAVLETRCYASERSLFLQPLVEALGPPLAALDPALLRAAAGARAAALAGLLPDLAEVLAVTDPGRTRPDVELQWAFEAVLAVLRALAARRPVLLLLDDLHNAGLATVELLHFLARRLGDARLLVLATVRAEEGMEALQALADVTHRLDVGPLDAAAVTGIATAAGRSDLAATIMRRTRGHPLFVVESLRAAVAGDSGVPESLQAAVLARLRSAGPETEEVLRAGAVLGATVDPEPVAALLEQTPLEVTRRCAAAVAGRLLVVTERSYEFANDVVQEVIYATTPAPVRRAHHRRAADVLSGFPEAVAEHAAAVQDWARAARALLVAGERAMNGLAMSDAQVLFGRALAAAERTADLELVGRARLARASAREALAQYPAAVTDLEGAVLAARQAGDRRLEMLALRALGGHAALAAGVGVDRCEAWLLESLRIAGSRGDRGFQASVLGWLAVLSTNRLRFDRAAELAGQAMRFARAAGTDHPLAAALDATKNMHAYLGQTGPLATVLDELMPLIRRIRDLRLLQWAVFESSFDMLRRADWAAAEQRMDEAIVLAQQSGHPAHESWYVAHLGWLARLQDRLDDAERLGRRAVELAGRFGHNWFRPTAAAFLARTLLARGERAAAAAVLGELAADAVAGVAEAHLLRRFAAEAEVSGAAERLAAAHRLLTGITAPEGTAWILGADTYLAVAEAWIAHGHPERARAVLAPLLAAAGTLGWLPVLAAAGVVDAQAAALLADPAAAAALARVAELADRHGMPGVSAAAHRVVVAT